MDLLKKTGNPNVLFMHCLPSFHNKDIVKGVKLFKKYGFSELEGTDEVFESQFSIVFD